MDKLLEFLPILVPLIIVQIILFVITLRHIWSHTEFKRGNRKIWTIVVIVGIQFWGPILYMVLGKEDEQ